MVQPVPFEPVLFRFEILQRQPEQRDEQQHEQQHQHQQQFELQFQLQLQLGQFEQQLRIDELQLQRLSDRSSAFG